MAYRREDTQAQTPSDDDERVARDNERSRQMAQKSSSAQKRKPSQGGTDNSSRKSQKSLQGYDATQSVSERRQLRKDYRKLTKETVESRQTYLKQGDPGIAHTVIAANDLYRRVRQTHEAVLDSSLLVITGEMAYQKVRNFKLGSSVDFDLDDFVIQVKKFLYGDRVRNENGAEEDSEDDECGFADEDTEAWAKLGKLASGVLLRPATHEFLAAHAEPRAPRAPVQRTQGQGLTRNKADLVRPEVIEESSLVRQENNTSTSVIMVKTVMEMLNRPVNAFELILNPDSFSQSVENMFYLSFLVRDGKVSLDEDENGILMASLVEMPDENDPQYRQKVEDIKRRRDQGQNQTVFELDYESWRMLIEAFDIKRSHIPTRATVQPVTNSSEGASLWYG
ncbi:Nse4 C-terminal-domain-containing protein [Lipomyces tetrasporus]|uniref:Non-structural maintenance of chromosomes element 4 n=1 Tax=Lipomyces tetrasporus TaxID=54092 RepID=A0AAD7VW92_9ASCO|nr:Nse4 C-terminal-domain-containing protein [Lipomyces tetrasporus]KAJ8103165.1 Nse4 C-terminal-domain-containing protein [Lipomyces tetrasporus]